MVQEMEVVNAIQDEYPDEFAWCHGCGRRNANGHHFRTGWDGDVTVTYYDPAGDELALPGFVYGGVIASLIDCHGTGSASLALHRKNGHEPGNGEEPPRFVTASLQVDFKKPTPHGKLLKATGRVEEIHPKKFKVITEVSVEGDVCATGEVVAVVMPENFLQK